MKRHSGDCGSPVETVTYNPCHSPAASNNSEIPYPTSVINSIQYSAVNISEFPDYYPSMPSIITKTDVFNSSLHSTLEVSDDINGRIKSLSRHDDVTNGEQSCISEEVNGIQPQSPNEESIKSMWPQLEDDQKVIDALTYLDAVRLKFSQHTIVYGEFLEVMKAFKSQSIDTPAVITKVSNLFKGFPELIMGFNTFLPAGYKIEVHNNDSSLGYSLRVSVYNNPSTFVSCVVTSSHISLSNSVSKDTVPTNCYLSNSVLVSSQTSCNPPECTILDPTSQAIPPTQPVEFNHAINYVNKIKNRFQGQPDKYKRFLEILHTYQKEQRTLKENQTNNNVKTLTEAEVYSQVAKLFENQEDLLAEFGQFLPDATSHQAPFKSDNNTTSYNRKVKYASYNNTSQVISNTAAVNCKLAANNASSLSSLKRSNSFSSFNSCPPVKKFKHTPLTEIDKYNSLRDFSYFDKLRKHINNNMLYQDFLRCIVLFNSDIVSITELLQIVTPLVQYDTKICNWFTNFLVTGDGSRDNTNDITIIHEHIVPQRRIIYKECKRLQSYRSLPDNYRHPKCSGRTELCKQVLNDQWVSVPSWSEDSTFVSSRKTQYEEYIYKCEDERFELDMLIECNASAIKSLDSVVKRLAQMSSEEASKVQLGDNLGGSSSVLNMRAIRKLYGEKSDDIILALKLCPLEMVPMVLRRLKIKDREWRSVKRALNFIWLDQNEKYYRRSLDHQSNNFKQNDMKYIRSKSLIQEIESLYEEKPGMPHIILPYDNAILDDVAYLLIHHTKRQPCIDIEEKRMIKTIMRQFIPDLFNYPRQELSDDESSDVEKVDAVNNNIQDDDDDNNESDIAKVDKAKKKTKQLLRRIKRRRLEYKKKYSQPKENILCNSDDIVLPQHALSDIQGECYTLFFGENHWYLFIRLHNIICQRLAKLYHICNDQKIRDKSPPNELACKLYNGQYVERYVEYDHYSDLLNLIKRLLDGEVDVNYYEETLRKMFGIHAYCAFTLDKVITNAVRQLHHVVSDASATQLYQLFLDESRADITSTGGRCSTAFERINFETDYQRKVENMTLDYSYKFIIYKIDCKISIECLDTEKQEQMEDDEDEEGEEIDDDEQIEEDEDEDEDEEEQQQQEQEVKPPDNEITQQLESGNLEQSIEEIQKMTS